MRLLGLHCVDVFDTFFVLLFLRMLLYDTRGILRTLMKRRSGISGEHTYLLVGYYVRFGSIQARRGYSRFNVLHHDRMNILDTVL